MGDKKKTTAIVLSSVLVGVPAIAGITIGIIALTRNRKETSPTVQSIEIVNDINPISLEQGQTYTTDEIVVKCYDQNKKEMSCQTRLSLLDNNKQPLSYDWIYINSTNQVIINSTAPVGQFSFLLEANTIDGAISSEVKSVDLTVSEKPTPPPTPAKFDKITIDVVETTDMFVDSTKKIKFTCKAWNQDVEYEGDIGEINWDFTITDASITGLTPPEIVKSVDKRVAEVTVISNGTTGPIGNYNLECKAILVNKPELSANAKCRVQVISAVTYTDTNGYVYRRADANSSWTLTTIPEQTQILDGIKDEILGYPVTTIAQYLAKNCSSMNVLGKVVLPASVKHIEDGAFYFCTSLRFVEMEGVETIGNEAFNYCQMMSISKQPKALKTIGDSAFYYCSGMTEINLSSATSVGSNAFYNSRIKAVELPAEFSVMHASSFSNCAYLKTFTIHATTPPVCEGKILTNCKNLTSIYVPSQSVDSYKNAEYWSDHKDKVVAIE